MRILYTLPFLVLPCFSLAQRKPSDWRPASLSPVEFAKRVDSGILNLKDAVGEATYRCEFFGGDYGGAVFTNRIRSRKTFRVEFGNVAEGTKDPFTRQTFIGRNGALYLLSASTGYKPLKPGVNPGLIPSNVSSATTWPHHFQQAMFQPLITGKGVFQPFVQALLKGDGGFSVQMHSRLMQSSTRTVPQVRLFAKRNAAAAKKLGQATIEIITDSNRYLPLQVRVSLVNTKGKKALFEWVSEWRGPVRFDDKWFQTFKKEEGARR